MHPTPRLARCASPRAFIGPRSCSSRHARTRRLRIAVLACAALVGSASVAEAQVPNLVDISAQYVPDDTDASSSGAEIATFRLGLNVPIPLSPRRFLILGGSYQVDAATVSAPMSVDRTFRTPGLSATLIQLLPNRWTWVSRVGASLSGDFDEVDRRMLAVSAMTIVSHPITERFSLGGGAIVSAGFGQVMPLPALLINWRPTDNLLVESLLPAFASARHTAWNRIELGTLVDIGGGNYAVRDSRTRDSWPCAGQATDDPMTTADETMARPDVCFDHVSYRVASASLLFGVRLTSSLWLTAYGGVSFYRQAEKRNRSGDALEGGTQSLPTAPFFRASMTWRIPRS